MRNVLRPQKSYLQNRVGFEGTILNIMCWEPKKQVRIDLKHSLSTVDLHLIAHRLSASLPHTLQSHVTRERTRAPG